MKRWTASIVAVVLVLVGSAAWSRDKPDSTPSQEYLIHVKVLQGDPLGSREEGTIHVLSEPIVVCRAKHDAQVSVGSVFEKMGEEIATGYVLKVQPEPSEENKVRLRVTVEFTDVVENRDKLARLRVDKTICETELPQGETFRLRLGERSGNETWVELKVQEMKK